MSKVAHPTNTTKAKKCRCKAAEAHPCYGGQCEDCWVLSQPKIRQQVRRAEALARRELSAVYQGPTSKALSLTSCQTLRRRWEQLWD